MPRRRRRCTVKTLPGLTELVSGDSGLDDPAAAGAGRGRARPRAGRGRSRQHRGLRLGRGRDGDRCRRLDRLRALPPALAARARRGSCSSTTPSRRCSRSTASSPASAGSCAGVPVVADVKDGVKMRQVFAKYRPGVVFHAAAYKHVAMMEANPIEAVRNNTLGTRTMADVAVEFGAKRFVLVSTDKAANPKTIMGQSKALCEWIVETWGHRGDVVDPVRRRALRERARLVRLGDPDLPPPDREGRPGDGDAPGDDAVLHDDPRGGAARRPGGRDRRARPGLRARHGRARADHGPGREHDPALGQGARDRESRSS